MAEDELRRLTDFPSLRAPVLVAAFEGWNDAGDVASYALETLITAWSPTRIAEIDPEEFLDFTETRPLISLDPTGQRSLEWPENAFFSHVLPGSDHDVVLFLGTEPNLRWKTFCRHIVTVAHEVGASCLVTLGGLLADVPHTREPMLTGFVSNPTLLPNLQDLGVRMSSYEGPTGILGALHEAWKDTGLPAVSLWGSVPHYITAPPNPQVTLALMRRLSTILGAPLPLSRVESHARAFALQVEEALKENPEALEYVRQLEEQHEGDAPPAAAPGLFEALEEFLRGPRPPDEEGDEDEK